MAAQQEVIAVYRDLMGDLARLPAEIATAKEAILPVKIRLAESEAVMKAIEDTYVPKGGNDTERKADKANFLAHDAPYKRFAEAAKRERADLAQLEINAESLEKQFIAVGFAARLHAGLMGYLAAAGSIPPVDISFNMGAKSGLPINNLSNGSNGHVTVAEAEAVLAGM